MRVMSWNCRGLGSPSTVPQLKESLRLFRPELIFLCETKRKHGFVGTVCKKIGWDDRWYAVEPRGRSGGLLLEWNSEVIIYQIISSSFCIEVEFETPHSKGKVWGVFVYASHVESVRAEQWQELWDKKGRWGNRWFLGGTLMT